jgi:uncharacterized protein (DUF2147 family)
LVSSGADTTARDRTDANARDEHNRNAAQRSRTLRNLPMLTGFTGGPTEWRNGSVYNPADGGTYRGTITMTNDNSLRLRGCIVAPLCKTQTWTRIQ